MSESAFGIRLELLKMAKEIIEHDYFTKRDMENQIWNTKADVARSKGEDIPSFTFTPYPSVDEIMKKAKELNRFISERQ
jgi:hypothetical protein